MLERIFKITAGYADDVPGRYGNYSGQTYFVVKGPKGAVEFHYFNPWYPDNCPRSDVRMLPLGGVEVHAKEPQYEGHEVFTSNCLYTDGPCYFNGSALACDKWFKYLVHCGSDKLWEKLEELYRYRFEDGDYPDLSYDPRGDYERLERSAKARGL